MTTTEPLYQPRASHPRTSSRPSLQRIGAALLVLSFSLVWWNVLRPSSLGGPLTLVTVNGVSMEPGLKTGDLAIVLRRAHYSKGDVVAFRMTNEAGEPGHHIIHRIIGGDGAHGFRVRGDNNDWVDPWEPMAQEVDGQMLFSLPSLGAAVTWVSHPLHFALLAASMTVGLLVAGTPSSPTASARRDASHPDEAVEPR